jgi:hypothetical protein
VGVGVCLGAWGFVVAAGGVAARCMDSLVCSAARMSNKLTVCVAVGRCVPVTRTSPLSATHSKRPYRVF